MVDTSFYLHRFPRNPETIFFFWDYFASLEPRSFLRLVVFGKYRVCGLLLLKFKNRLRNSGMRPALHEALRYCNDMMHGRLRLAGYYDELCRPDVSLGAHYSFLGNLKLRRRNLRWAMHIKSDGANFLTITCIRICLKMNQRPSRQRRSVPRWRTRAQLRRQILKQWWEDWFLLSCHLSDTLLRPGTAWNWTSTDRPDNEGMYLFRGPNYGEEF